MPQLSLFNQAANPNDVVYTEYTIALDIVRHFKPMGRVLDPCRGDGVFYRALQEYGLTPEYCEIDEGKDFYAFWEEVDWCIGNPPYSLFLEWMKHSFEVAKNIVYLVPTNKVFQSWNMIAGIEKYGGIHGMLVFGSGRSIGLPFGFSVGAFHFQRGYHGLVDLQFKKPPLERPKPMVIGQRSK